MITDEDYEKYIRIHMPNIRKLTLEHTVKTEDNTGHVYMCHQVFKVNNLTFTTRSNEKGCLVDVRFDEATDDIGTKFTFVLSDIEIDEWNQSLSNLNEQNQKSKIVLIEDCKQEKQYHPDPRIAPLATHRSNETVYRSTKLILNK